MSRIRTWLAALLVFAPAGAEAGLLAFEGRILAVLPGLAEAEVARGPGVARVDALQVSRVELLSAHVAGTASLPVTDPGAAPLTALRVQASLPAGGTVSLDPLAPPFSEPRVTGALALPGQLRVCMLVGGLPPCEGGFALALTDATGTAAFGVGVGGLLTLGGSGTLRVSLHAAPFTLQTAWVGGQGPDGTPFTLFSTGSIAGPALFTSSAGQTGGRLSLVTPVRVASGGAGAAADRLPGFLRLEIAFVPEPGAALLSLCGALSLLALARRRNRSRALPGER